ncbi:unnamed protein product [Soboliphyme baturini]|uniref:Aladin n=1 Tax=Soboliphyme baturini TaxID=241478 RepID=A0A183IB86_9BILA|nr:unnamed protein product [Soboliphyme baturini]
MNRHQVNALAPFGLNDNVLMFPVSSPIEIKNPGKSFVGGVKWVLCNRERTIAAVLWRNALLLYYTHPRVMLCCHQRSPNDVFVRGENECILWKPDSSAVLISSKARYLFFYSVAVDVESESYKFIHDKDTPRPDNIEMVVRPNIPKVTLTTSTVVQLSSRAVT